VIVQRRQETPGAVIRSSGRSASQRTGDPLCEFPPRRCSNDGSRVAGVYFLAFDVGGAGFGGNGVDDGVGAPGAAAGSGDWPLAQAGQR
jgi:hypothetical protein